MSSSAYIIGLCRELCWSWAKSIWQTIRVFDMSIQTRIQYKHLYAQYVHENFTCQSDWNSTNLPHKAKSWNVSMERKTRLIFLLEKNCYQIWQTLRWAATYRIARLRRPRGQDTHNHVYHVDTMFAVGYPILKTRQDDKKKIRRWPGESNPDGVTST